MAGKTFSGIGVDDLDKLIPPVGRDGAAPDAAPVPRPEGDDAEDVRGVYSGPTVVDDDKVAEGLKRLRSLERTTAVGTGPPALKPPDPAGEVSELVADMDSSEPTKIGMPHQRPTAMGHSVGDDAPGQQQPVGQIDNLRGTMFGHMVHLPDLHIPIDTDEPSGPVSGPIYTPPKPAATQQLVRYKPPPGPSMNAYPQAPPASRSPFPSNEADLRTETIPPLERGSSARVVAAVVGMAVLGAGAALAFRYYRSVDAATSAPPPAEIAGPPPAIGLPAPAAPAAPAAPPNPAAPAAAAAPPNPAAPAPPNPAAPAPPNPAAPAAAAPAAAAEPTAPGIAEAPPPPAAKPSPANDPPLGDSPPPRRASGESNAVVAPPTAAAPEGDRPRRRGGHPDKRRAPATAAPATAAPTAEAPAAAPKPPPHKKAALDEDPDATLPPSTTE